MIIKLCNRTKKTVEEINLKIEDMDLEIFQARHGRKIVQVEIHNNWTVQRAIEKNTDSISGLSAHDWSEEG